MAKATIITPDGTAVKIDGTPEEIAALVKRLRPRGTQSASASRPTRRQAAPRPTLVDLIDSLVDGTYFKVPRGLADVKSTLAEMGHHYPMTTLSGAMLRQVRRGNLRRLKKDKRWLYTKRDK